MSRLQRMSRGKYPFEIHCYVISDLCKQKQLQTSRGLVHLPRHNIALTERESLLWQRANWLIRLCGDFSMLNDIALKSIRHFCYKLVQLCFLTSILKDRYVMSESIYH
nr:hypothetical protein [Shewanella benthica]